MPDARAVNSRALATSPILKKFVPSCPRAFGRSSSIAEPLTPSIWASIAWEQRGALGALARLGATLRFDQRVGPPRDGIVPGSPEQAPCWRRLPVKSTSACAEAIWGGRHEQPEGRLGTMTLPAVRQTRRP
jgi:hypothetical protein